MSLAPPAEAIGDATRARLVSGVESLFAAAENEAFEVGFDSAFSLELQRLVLKHGAVTVEIVSDLIGREHVAREGRPRPCVASAK